MELLWKRIVCFAIFMGFFPIFMFLHLQSSKKDNAEIFQRALNAKIHNSVFNVELQRKQNIYGFYGNQKALFLKITLFNPKMLPAVKRVLEGEFTFDDGPSQSYFAFESNLEFTLRLMIDLKVRFKFGN